MPTSTRPPVASPALRAANFADAITIVIGLWVFLSAFLWRHRVTQMTNTWLVGVVTAAVALIALIGVRGARYANMVLAVWLFVSAFAMRSTSATIWNNTIAAVLIFVFSVLPVGATPSREAGRGRA